MALSEQWRTELALIKNGAGVTNMCLSYVMSYIYTSTGMWRCGLAVRSQQQIDKDIWMSNKKYPFLNVNISYPPQI